MSSITLNTVRYYTGNDPYHYTIDNRPLQDLASNDVILQAAIENLSDIVGVGLYLETFNNGADFTAGTSTTLSLVNSPGSSTSTWVFFDGIYQDANTYSLSGTTITFNSAIPSGVLTVEVRWMTSAEDAVTNIPTVYYGTSLSLGGSAMTAGQVTSTTVSIPGVTQSMAIAVTPFTYPGDSFTWAAYVSVPGVVVVRLIALSAGTPTASTYNVRVIA
jgi:hypothetical protein